MVRCRVTYREAADERPVRSAAAALLELEVEPRPARPAWAGEPGAPPVRTPPAPPRRRRWPLPAAGAGLLAAALVFAVVAATGDEDPVDPEPAAARPAVTSRGPVVIATASVLAEPWGGVFEHHPDARGTVSVPRVHLVALAGPDARALLVVDATRRAFGGAAHRSGDGTDERVLGAPEGRGLRTLQWDAGGYGLSLTSVGLALEDQRAVAEAILLPPGPSLRHGRPPSFDDDALRGVGLAVTERRSGAATAYGSPLIGQSGGGAIEGQLHRSGVDPVLVSVVQDQLVSAARMRRALGATVSLDLTDLPGISGAATLDHGASPEGAGRIRGWSRLVLDHEVGVTIELSSDVLGPDGLAEVARAMDLGRLARTTSPLG